MHYNHTEYYTSVKIDINFVIIANLLTKKSSSANITAYMYIL